MRKILDLTEMPPVYIPKRRSNLKYAFQEMTRTLRTIKKLWIEVSVTWTLKLSYFFFVGGILFSIKIVYRKKGKVTEMKSDPQERIPGLWRYTINSALLSCSYSVTWKTPPSKVFWLVFWFPSVRFLNSILHSYTRYVSLLFYND